MKIPGLKVLKVFKFIFIGLSCLEFLQWVLSHVFYPEGVIISEFPYVNLYLTNNFDMFWIYGLLAFLLHRLELRIRKKKVHDQNP